VTNCTPTSKTTVRPRHRRKLYFSSIADEISILYELDIVTKLQRSPRKSKLHATGSLAMAYIILPTTCIFQNAIVCILVIQAAACIWAYAGCSNLHTSVVQHAAACYILHTSIMQDALRRYAGFIRSYAACVRSYCSLHAGTHAACMPP